MYLFHGKHSPWKEQSCHNRNMVIGIHNIYKTQLLLKGLAGQMGETNTSFALILIQTADFWARTKSQPTTQLTHLMKSCLYCALLILLESHTHITELYCIFTYSTTLCHYSSQQVVSCITYWHQGLPCIKHHLTPSITDRIKIKNTALIMPSATCFLKRIKMCKRIPIDW